MLMVEDVLETNSTNLDVGTLYRYQYSNHLGSVALELDEKAKIISYEEYHPYGTSAYQAKNKDIKSTAKHYLYTGMERDDETGLNYHGARYYAAWLGRWMSCDPIGIKDGLNIYVYIKNNPVIFIDYRGTATTKRDAGSSPADVVKQGDAGSLSAGVTKIKKSRNLCYDDPIAGCASSPVAEPDIDFLKPVPPDIDILKATMDIEIEILLTMINPFLGLAYVMGRSMPNDKDADILRPMCNIAMTRSIANSKFLKAIEGKYAYIKDPKLKSILVEMEIEGVGVPGKVVEVNINDTHFGLVKEKGGAYHNIKEGTTYVNLEEITAQLYKYELNTPKQVLLHESGHYGQTTCIETDTGDVSYPAYYRRESAASRNAAETASSIDKKALLKHADEQEKIAKMLE